METSITIETLTRLVDRQPKVSCRHVREGPFTERIEMTLEIWKVLFSYKWVLEADSVRYLQRPQVANKVGI